MLKPMRALVALALLMSPAAAAAQPAAQAIGPPPYNPAAAYITIGQDEAGYRAWYGTTALHAIQVKAFNDYLSQWGVGGIVPTWQLLRTATSWQRCGAQPFEVPPLAEWPHIVQTLRYVHDYVVPTVGPVEPVSGYRNPLLNVCAGGAPESAHKHYSAIDLVPLQPITREHLMHKLCAIHARRGTAYDVGLGFYAFLRFHVDTTKFRRWGADPGVASCPPIIRPADIATVGPAVTPPLDSKPTETATAGTAPLSAAAKPAVTSPAAASTAPAAGAVPPNTPAPAGPVAQPTTSAAHTPERGQQR
jgi:hypothetical protein